MTLLQCALAMKPRGVKKFTATLRPRRPCKDEAGHNPTPQSAMATRHADEIAEQRAHHHGESQTLYQKQAQARAAKLQTSHGLNGNLDRDQSRERDELHEKHSGERSAMQRRHLIERDKLRSKKRS
jgi:hypothetical protein